jgi:hypothetical protein
MIKSLTPELLYNGLSDLDHSHQVWTHVVNYLQDYGYYRHNGYYRQNGYDDYDGYYGNYGYAAYKLLTNNFVKVHN